MRFAKITEGSATHSVTVWWFDRVALLNSCTRTRIWSSREMSVMPETMVIDDSYLVRRSG